MKQTIIFTRLADRHAGDERDFAESWDLEVDAGTLSDVLLQAAHYLGPPGRYQGKFTITISEPYDEDLG